MKYQHKPEIVEAITFDELVQYGLEHAGKHIVRGIPWSFNYKGHSITNENRECYVIPGFENNHLTPNDMLITNIKGEIYVLNKNEFEDKYELIEGQDTWMKVTFEE